MAHVTVERIAAVQAHIVEAITQTSPSSKVPESVQDWLLAQSCAEACDLLKDWLADAWWEQVRPAADDPIAKWVPTHQEYAQFLGPALEDSLAQAGRYGITVPDSLVEEARASVAATARRFPRMKRQQLFDVARMRVTALQTEVCRLTGELPAAKRTGGQATAPAVEPLTAAGSDSAWRRRARKILEQLPVALLSIVLAMAAAGPHAMAHDAAEWGDAAVHAVEVITVHYVAAQAAPSVRVAPPHAGPRIH